jgi:hypothetical protein
MTTRRPTRAYSPPRITTFGATEVLATLGPASAGGSGQTDAFEPNTSNCGSAMGYPCP